MAQHEYFAEMKRDIMADSYFDVSDEDFIEKVIQAPQMVLVNFSTDTSAACQIQDPEFGGPGQQTRANLMFGWWISYLQSRRC